MKLGKLMFLLGVLNDTSNSAADTEIVLLERDDLTDEARAQLEGTLAGELFKINELADIDIETYNGIWLRHGTIELEALLERYEIEDILSKDE